jgi:hypothetical protein
MLIVGAAVVDPRRGSRPTASLQAPCCRRVRHEKRGEVIDDLDKRAGPNGDIFREGIPLLNLRRVFRKSARERVRQFRWNRRLAAREGRGDRSGEAFAFKLV